MCSMCPTRPGIAGFHPAAFFFGLVAQLRVVAAGVDDQVLRSQRWPGGLISCRLSINFGSPVLSPLILKESTLGIRLLRGISCQIVVWAALKVSTCSTWCVPSFQRISRVIYALHAQRKGFRCLAQNELRPRAVIRKSRSPSTRARMSEGIV